MNQVFQPVRRDIQRDEFASPFFSRCGCQSLGLKYPIDLTLDIVEFDLVAAATHTGPKSVERIQLGLPRLRHSYSHKLPRSSQHGGQRTEHHRHEENEVAPFIEKADLCPIVEFS